MAIPKPLTAPLTPPQAANTLAARLAPIASNIRQIATRLGARPYRVWLVWGKWSGGARGEGSEVEVLRQEILPTPVVTSMDNVALSPHNIGLVQIGDVKISEISALLSEDNLMGRTLGAGDAQVEQPYTFYWEISADGRAGDTPVRSKFRVRGRPVLQADNAQWVVNLEKISDDAKRDGRPQGEPR